MLKNFSVLIFNTILYLYISSVHTSNKNIQLKTLFEGYKYCHHAHPPYFYIPDKSIYKKTSSYMVTNILRSLKLEDKDAFIPAIYITNASLEYDTQMIDKLIQSQKFKKYFKFSVNKIIKPTFLPENLQNNNLSKGCCYFHHVYGVVAKLISRFTDDYYNTKKNYEIINLLNTFIFYTESDSTKNIYEIYIATLESILPATLCNIELIFDKIKASLYRFIDYPIFLDRFIYDKDRDNPFEFLTNVLIKIVTEQLNDKKSLKLLDSRNYSDPYKNQYNNESSVIVNELKCDLQICKINIEKIPFVVDFIVKLINGDIKRHILVIFMLFDIIVCLVNDIVLLQFVGERMCLLFKKILLDIPLAALDPEKNFEECTNYYYNATLKCKEILEKTRFLGNIVLSMVLEYPRCSSTRISNFNDYSCIQIISFPWDDVLEEFILNNKTRDAFLYYLDKILRDFDDSDKNFISVLKKIKSSKALNAILSMKSINKVLLLDYNRIYLNNVKNYKTVVEILWDFCEKSHCKSAKPLIVFDSAIIKIKNLTNDTCFQIRKLAKEILSLKCFNDVD